MKRQYGVEEALQMILKPASLKCTKDCKRHIKSATSQACRPSGPNFTKNKPESQVYALQYKAGPN